MTFQINLLQCFNNSTSGFNLLLMSIVLSLKSSFFLQKNLTPQRREARKGNKKNKLIWLLNNFYFMFLKNRKRNN